MRTVTEGTKLIASPWQTVGPFFSLGLAPGYIADLAGPTALGERISISGQVFDGEHEPICDALLEIWQADAHGKYHHPEDTQKKPLDPNFLGYGRVPTDRQGRFRFTTIKPGSVDSYLGPQAPHLCVSLVMRGLLRRVTTRIYFPNEPLNTIDPVLKLVEPSRTHTLLLASRAETADNFCWDIHMQGEKETVFFEF
jgi:protocatechuate 3,4-dioxygenase, alpha subunit